MVDQGPGWPTADLLPHDDPADAPGTGYRPVVLRGRGVIRFGRDGALLASGLFVCLLTAGALVPGTPPQRPADVAAALGATGATPATWVAISHPLPLYGIASAALAGLSSHYEARRTADGAVRQDFLSFGEFGGPSPFLQLAIRHATAPARVGEGTSPARTLATPQTDLFVDLVRLAATGGLALTHAGVADPLSTRLGLLAAAPVTLQDGARGTECLGFRLEEQAPVSITGMACGGGTASVDRAALACLVGRIGLLAGSDEATRLFLGGGERRQSADCAPLTPLRSAAR